MSEEQEQFLAVRDIATHEEPNPKKRKSMEDVSLVIDGFGGDPNVALVALFDGHGGQQVSSYCGKMVPDVLNTTLQGRCVSSLTDEEVGNVLADTLKEVDAHLVPRSDLRSMGTTAVLCLVDKGRDRLVVANIGDTRVVLCCKTEPHVLRLSVDHRPCYAEEIERIKALGGYIKNDRVLGIIAVSRSIGDHGLKKYLVPEAHVGIHRLSDIERFIVGCDGLFDVVDDGRVCEIARGCATCAEAASALITAAFIQDSNDNISVIVVDP